MKHNCLDSWIIYVHLFKILEDSIEISKRSPSNEDYQYPYQITNMLSHLCVFASDEDGGYSQRYRQPLEDTDARLKHTAYKPPTVRAAKFSSPTPPPPPLLVEC